MSQSGIAGSTLSLEQFVQLNDEIAALVRAGIPLEQGLFNLASEWPGRLGEFALQLGKRIQSGETLDQILASNTSGIPNVWRAVVIAGLRSGKLIKALEEISSTARRIAEMRRGIRVAMIYPAVVITFAFASFVLLVTYLAPRMFAACRDLTSTSEPFLATLTWLGQSAKWWAIGLPLIAILMFAIWWRRANTSNLSSAAISRFRWWPAWKGTIQDGQVATFAEILALMLRQHVPLDEAITLAGDASGDANLRQRSRDVAERLRSGEIVTSQSARMLGLPPLLGWLLSVEKQPMTLATSLAQFAEDCRQRAEREAAYTVTYLPIVVTVVTGGLITLAHGFAYFLPISHLLYRLGSP